MKADDWQMSKVFLGGGDVQYVLPIFQREYAWEENEWRTLLEDVIETYNESQNGHHEHFLGSLVVIEEESEKTLFQSYTLVDGQQRLTSISILLCAIRDLLANENRLRRKINRYLYNTDAPGELQYKILPTKKYDDRQTYVSLLNGKAVDKSTRSRIIDAYAFYKTRLQGMFNDKVVEAEDLVDGILSLLYIVFIQLNRTDKPYKIFESLNHRGKALTQADLVRNYIAMCLPPTRQQEIFDAEWRQVEDKLSDRRETARIPELTAFLRHYLAMHLGDLPRTDQVYNRFRDRIEKRMNTAADAFVTEIQKLSRFASYYEKLLRPEYEAVANVRDRLERLNILEPTTAYPLLMYYYDLFEHNTICECEFQKTLEVVENYLVRRFLAGEATNYHNSMFTSLAHEVMSKNEQTASALEAALGDRNYPSDNRLLQRLMWNRLYSTNKSRRIVFVLETIGLHISSEVTLAKEGTVEHIMPQSPNEEWKAHLGENWQDVHRELLHTIGNLTIVSQPWNAMLSNSGYPTKRNKLLKQDLPLNTHYFSNGPMHWGESEIRKRAEFLAEAIVSVWPAFTEPPRAEGVTGRQVLTLSIQESLFPVQTWKGMVVTMVTRLHELRLLADKARALEELKWWFVENADHMPWAYARLSEGWWFRTHLSAEDAVKFCTLLAKYCGLRDDEWSFTFE